MKNKLARIKYLPNNFEILEEGDHVICAISGKKIFGSWGGEVNPDKDIPLIWNLIRKNGTNLNDFIQKEYSLDCINLALQDLDEGKVLRPLIKMDH